VLERFARGELDAFETLFRQHQAEVYRWIARMVRDAGVAEELTVETFWRIYRAHARFDASRSFGAWARRIASNAALDHLKTAKPQVELTQEPAAEVEGDPVLRQELRHGIHLAFSQLPAKLRATAILALVEEQPYEEIAAALGTSVAAVKSRVFRAVRLLRRKLRSMGVEP